MLTMKRYVYPMILVIDAPDKHSADSEAGWFKESLPTFTARHLLFDEELSDKVMDIPDEDDELPHTYNDPNLQPV